MSIKQYHVATMLLMLPLNICMLSMLLFTSVFVLVIFDLYQLLLLNSQNSISTNQQMINFGFFQYEKSSILLFLRQQH